MRTDPKHQTPSTNMSPATGASPVTRRIRSLVKTASGRATYVDYTTARFGVRVREFSCCNLMWTGTSWEEYGRQFPLPLTARMLDLASNDCLDYDLSMNLADYEMERTGDVGENRTELRGLLLGIIDLKTALTGI